MPPPRARQECWSTTPYQTKWNIKFQRRFCKQVKWAATAWCTRRDNRKQPLPVVSSFQCQRVVCDGEVRSVFQIVAKDDSQWKSDVRKPVFNSVPRGQPLTFQWAPCFPFYSLKKQTISSKKPIAEAYDAPTEQRQKIRQIFELWLSLCYTFWLSLVLCTVETLPTTLPNYKLSVQFVRCIAFSPETN